MTSPLTHAVAIVLLAAPAMAQTRATDPLTQARDHYNGQRYDEAIKAAHDAQAVPALREAAAVVLARAHLERFRQNSERTDLDASRAVLKAIDVSVLNPRERVELLIALGTSLYYDDSYSLDDRNSAAAEQFEVALGGADLLDARNRDLLFDWWASALDQQAVQGDEAGRRVLYQRILTRAQSELAHDGSAVAATYWLAAASRGVNDLPRAMGAAIAGWIRAATLGTRGATLRADLDRLMRQVILPERAQELAVGADPHPVLTLLETQWQDVKAHWEQ